MQNYPNYQAYNPYQPIQMQPSLASKIVDDFSVVGASDVPMDGNPAIFLKRDLSEVQIRKWGADGRIYATTYKPHIDDFNNVSVNTPTNNQEESLNGLNERLQAIEDKIDKLIKPTTTKKVTNDVNN